jgi:beta-lactamase superfamily II metal-dependent hydrolase
VILSHWDWDHLHGYHVVDGLASSTWIVPVQKLGPGAARVAHTLAGKKRLLGLQNAMFSVGPLKIGTCAGKPGNLNQTGLCVEVNLNSGRCVLYMGDADYDLAPRNVTSSPDHLVVTHHGAEFSGGVVSPSSTLGRCVVSVGKGNTYRHPSERALAAHVGVGWNPVFTCSRNGARRGSYILN